MQQAYKTLRGLIRSNPLALTSVTDPKLLSFINNHLPYSTGIEWECMNKDKYSSCYELSNKIRTIPGVMDVDIESTEKRVRIPSGLQGMICLYKVSEVLQDTCALNIQSGIHYHIDMTDVDWKKVTEDDTEWILKSLDKWGYTGHYNSRRVSFCKDWVKLHAMYKTMEIRIGEMTFDYSLLMKRIINCQNIVRLYKSKIKTKVAVREKNPW